MFPYSEIKLQLVCMPQIFVLYYGHYLSIFSVLLPSSRSQRCLNVVRYAFDKEFLRTARQYKETHETPKDQFWLNQFWQIPIYKRIMILGAGFYVIPHKISEYLRADFPSNVNNVSSTNSKQSELCVNSSCNIDTRLFRKATICSNCTQ